MPRDLLEELARHREYKGNNFDMSIRFNYEEETLLGGFFDNVGMLRQALHSFRTRIDEVKELHTLILTSVLAPEETQKTRDRLQDKMAETNKIIKGIRAGLQKMKSLVDEDESNTIRKGDTIIRIKKTQHETIHRQFYLLLAEYNTCQSTFKENSKQRIKRQFEIASKDITDEQIDDYIEQDSNILQQGIFTDTEQAKMALAEIEARHKDIMHLEKTLIELTQLFTEIADLVQNQGEIIDRVEYNVGLTQDYVEDSNRNLKKAEEYQSSARKKKIILFAIIAVIVIIIIIVLATQIPRNN